MRHYITETERKLIILAFIFYTVIEMLLCFKGMALMADYKELAKENENLKSVIEILENRKGIEDVKNKG